MLRTINARSVNAVAIKDTPQKKNEGCEIFFPEQKKEKKRMEERGNKSRRNNHYNWLLHLPHLWLLP